MTSDPSVADALQASIRQAFQERVGLNIVGGNSKAFIGRKPAGQRLDVSQHKGIVNYEPTELVITARGATRLGDLDRTLEANGQMLAFEPPHFSTEATIAGTIACGLSGPRRPYAGAARDFMLGVKMINGKGEYLQFGGQVMKNVAGYDLSRLMVGAMGTLGVLLEVSLKVLPRPAMERTLVFEMNGEQAIRRMNELAATPAPVNAAAFIEDRLYIRMSGTNVGVDAACRRLGGDSIDGAELWLAVREQTHQSFAGDSPLWRLSLPSATPYGATEKPVVIDWGGALRWVRSHLAPESMQERVSRLGGHAWPFRDGKQNANTFHPLPAPILNLHRRLKHAFDPNGILNPGRLYAEL